MNRTLDLPSREGGGAGLLGLGSAAAELDCAGRTHVGAVRRLNEDQLLMRPDLGLWAVADGMGGHQAGDVASALIVEALAQSPRPRSGYAHLTAACERLQEVNGELVRRAQSLNPGEVIGATTVVLLVHDGHYACVWAGDCRAYLFRDGALRQITRDHSLVQELVESGALTPDEARHHHRANVVTRAVGAGPVLELETRSAPVKPGDLFLLCSDGLTGALEEGDLVAALRQRPLESAAEALIAESLARGAKDNVTVVLVAGPPLV